MRSRAPLSLMEQLVMLGVFALAAALCLQAFVRSDALSRERQARDRAAVVCQNAAEVICHTGRPESVRGQWYDEDWAPVPEGGGAYLLEVRELESETAGLGRAAVTVTERDGGMLFELKIAWQEEAEGIG